MQGIPQDLWVDCWKCQMSREMTGVGCSSLQEAKGTLVPNAAGLRLGGEVL